MPRKQQKPDHNSPTKTLEKRTKENMPSICPVCDTVIAEDTDDIAGDDAVYCEGTCAIWLHRKCASMAKIVYDKLRGSEDPYFVLIVSLANNQKKSQN